MKIDILEGAERKFLNLIFLVKNKEFSAKTGVLSYKIDILGLFFMFSPVNMAKNDRKN